MHSSSPSAPPLVEHAEIVVAALGHFDLRGAELRAVRLALAPGSVPVLEVDLFQSAGDAGDAPDAERVDVAAYRVTLRCTDIADLGLADFEHRNVVGSWSVEPLGDAEPDGRCVRVSIIGVDGCDLELRCAAVAVVDVAPVPRAPAV